MRIHNPKDRNAKHIKECIAAKEFDVLLKSMSGEFLANSILIDAEARIRKLPNNLVWNLLLWISADGVPPSNFLRADGVAFRTESSAEQPTTHA